MRVAFCTFGSNPKSFKSNSVSELQRDYLKKQRKLLFEDLSLSIGVGVVAGATAAGIMRYRKLPNVFVNSLEIGSVFSYLTYMGTLIATPFRVK